MDAKSPPPSFAQQVKERIDANERRGPHLEHGSTPAVLRLIGFPALPLVMAPNVLWKIASGKGGERSPLTVRQIQQLPELLDDPVAIFPNPGGGSLIVLSYQFDSAGNPIVVCVRPDLQESHRQVNVITTAFGKDNAVEWVEKIAPTAVFVGEKNNPRLPLPDLIYHQTGAHKTEGSTRILLGPQDLINYRAAQRSAKLNG